MRFRRPISLAAVVLLLPFGVLAQDRPTKTPLTGAWRFTEVIRTGANPVERRTPQPGLLVFTGRYYSIVFVNSNEPRTPLPIFKEAGKPTHDELEAVYRHWDPLTAQAGTYEVTGSTLTLRPFVAKNQNVEGRPSVREFTIAADTLTLIERSAAGQPQFVTTVRLMRVE